MVGFHTTIRDMATPTISAKKWREQGGDIDPSDLADEQAEPIDGPQEYQFVVPGRPVPWQRTARKNGRRFTRRKSREYKKLVQQYARLLPVREFDGDVEVHCRFYRGQATRRRRQLREGDSRCATRYRVPG